LTISAALACIGTSPGAGAGLTVEVSAGTYVESITNNLPSGTSWSAPFTLRAKSGDIVTIRANAQSNVYIYLPAKQAFYSIIQGFRFDGSNLTGDQMSFGSCCDGVGFVRFLNNEIINTNAGNAVFIGRFSHDIAFTGNRIHGGLYSCIYCGGGAYTYPFYVEGSYNLVEGNEIYDVPSWAIHMYSGYTEVPSNNIVRKNRIYNFGSKDSRATGILLSTGSNNVAYNNVIYSGSKGISLWNCTNCQALNNTIYGTNVGIEYGTRTGQQVINNILYQNSTNLLALDSSVVQLSNNLTSDPSFADASKGNFGLTAGSAAIDAGMSLVQVPDDIGGVARPRYKAWDIGAYEYQ
jgi:parallel beta-helix repeat protein